VDTIKVQVGRLQALSSGAVQDDRQDVEFEAEVLGELRTYGYGRDGNPTDTRGATQTLYKLADGRLLVHTHQWSAWEGESTLYHLAEVVEADLDATGDHAALGAESGYGRPLTVDEVLARDIGDADEPPF